MSLDQDNLSEGKGSRKGSMSASKPERIHDPDFQYLADLVNLESEKWAVKGIEQLEKEFKSAKSQKKRTRIIHALDDAVRQADALSKSPDISPERRKELEKISGHFSKTHGKLLVSAQDQYVAEVKARPEPKEPTPQKESGIQIPAGALRARISKIDAELDEISATIQKHERRVKEEEGYGHTNFAGIYRGKIQHEITKMRELEKEKKKFVDLLSRTPQYQEYSSRLEKAEKAANIARTMYSQPTREQITFIGDKIVRSEETHSREELRTMIQALETYIETQEKMGIKPSELDIRMVGSMKKKLFSETSPPSDLSMAERRARYSIKQKQGYARVVPIDQISEPDKPFHERPTAGKKFTDIAGLGKEYQLWELDEFEYHRYEFYKSLKDAENQIKWRKMKLDEKRSDGKHVIRGKKREEEESHLAYWEKRLTELTTTTPEETWKERKHTPYRYTETVKKAIKSGKPVPQSVIDQYSEFKIAEDARERYEKGLHTSFANRSIAINETMRDERGIKVKRQDGKEITPKQIEYIMDGVSEVEEIFGKMDDIFRQTDITIAHTSGKHPFLSKAGGTYSTTEKTVSIGVKVMGKDSQSLAHELGHWLDFESGATKGLAVIKVRGKGRKRVVLSSLSEIDAVDDNTQLIQSAIDMMSDVQMAEKLMKMKEKEAKTQEELELLKMARVKLGPYYFEPCEVWARLTEQYVATVSAERGLEPKIAVRSKEFYNDFPSYWTSENFEILRPLYEKELQDRVAILRAEAVKDQK